jgi:hypothetical protein
MRRTASLPGALPQLENLVGYVDLNLVSALAKDVSRIAPEAFGAPVTCPDQSLLEKLGRVENSSFIPAVWMIVGLSNAAGAAGYFALLGQYDQELALDGGALIAIASMAGLLFACRKLGHLPPTASA